MKTAIFAAFLVLFPLLAQADGAWKTTNIGGIHYAVERSVLHPDRWQKELQQTYDCQAPCTIAFDDRVSAVHLRYKWAQLNPAQGRYDFDDLGQVLDRLHATGKRATLIVMAGKYTPAWVFENGAGHISTPAKTNGRFSQPLVPLPWDPVYLEAYESVLKALSRFLQQSPSRYRTVGLVKNGAVVVHSGETRLMPVEGFDTELEVNKEDKNSKDQFYNMLCADWARSGYSEQRILSAIHTSNASVTSAFRDQYIGLAYVSGSNRFPSVTADGTCDPKAKNNTLTKIIKETVKTYGSRAVIISTVLTPKTGNPPIMQWVKRNGGHIGFQINRQVAGCHQRAKNSCDASLFLKTLQSAIAARGLFVEVHDGNIHRYKDMLSQADSALKENWFQKQ